MPDSTGNFKGIAISHVPWHLAKENHNLSSHWFCEGEACERDCHCPSRTSGLCDEARCEKPCKRCDKGGTKEGNDW